MAILRMHGQVKHRGQPASNVTVVKKGSALVRIYPIKNRGRIYHSVTWFFEGKRQRRSFIDQNVARREAANVAAQLNFGNAQILTLRSTDRASYLAARDLLAPLKIPLYDAIRDYVAARRILQNEPLLPAVRFYVERAHQKLPSRTVQEVYDEFKQVKRADGASVRYLQDIQSRLGRFARDFRVTITAIGTPTLDQWIRSLNVSARSRKNVRILLIALFNFAKSCGYLPRDVATAADGLPKPKIAEQEIEIYTPAEMRALLKNADEHTLPALCLGGFAGLRTAEIQRLNWEDIKWDQKVIDIRAKAAKTGQRRLVPILAPLRAFLLPFGTRRGGVIAGVKIDPRMRAMADAAKVERKHNGLRHSFASYRLAQIKSIDQVALEMGNSAKIIFKCYRELVTDSAAKEWWSLKPVVSAKIIMLPTAASFR
jgi:integrase